MDGDLFPSSLVTDRLSLEPLSREAVGVMEYYQIVGHDDGIDEVTEYVPWEPHETPKETFDFLELVESQRADGENAEWVVRPNKTEDGAGELTGVVGLKPHWDRRVGNLGVWFRKRFWGRGYADEALSALLPVAFERLGLDLVEAYVRPGNEKSRRAFEKFVEKHGGRLDGTIRNGWVDQNGTVHDQCQYSIAAEEWASARSQR